MRAALREYLREHRPAPVDRDPLLDLVGLVDDPEGPDDVAEEHDHYVYGAPVFGLDHDFRVMGVRPGAVTSSSSPFRRQGVLPVPLYGRS